MRRTCGPACFCLCILAATSARCFGDLVNAGDIAFIGINLDVDTSRGVDDSFAIVLLADAAASDVIHFNNNEWSGTSFNGAGEAEFTWTVGSALPAGTVVTFSNVRLSTRTVSTGSLSGELMSLTAGDAIFAYTGPDVATPTSFLAAISVDPDIYDDTNSGDGTLTGTGLTLGTTAVLLPSSGSNFADGGAYIGPRSGEGAFADYLSLIGNTSGNWDVDLSDGTQYVPFDTTAFTITSTPVPEPAGLTLALVGIALLSGRSIRQKFALKSRES